MQTATLSRRPPFTRAVKEALREANNSEMEADLLFLEAWEMRPAQLLGATLRASQIRRANPRLAEEIDAEIKGAIKNGGPGSGN